MQARKKLIFPNHNYPAAHRVVPSPGPVSFFFDEKPYRLDENVNSIVYKADLCLVVGTSSTFRPASTYAFAFSGIKARLPFLTSLRVKAMRGPILYLGGRAKSSCLERFRS